MKHKIASQYPSPDNFRFLFAVLPDTAESDGSFQRLFQVFRIELFLRCNPNESSHCITSKNRMSVMFASHQLHGNSTSLGTLSTFIAMILKMFLSVRKRTLGS